eukprot:CAMPEP_0194294436 /NCGR_PEP_ID=MMETSP0169-20130528/50640_1 /TAXON_ID=218684 /ORGANISM="Corethron pennatum, Strain L29A3" /LENGTH=135 /DNA_ID=CAMNT_0039043287 /DNA_START=58 /DNA_END=461 /DNA_ORIENTATION=-
MRIEKLKSKIECNHELKEVEQEEETTKYDEVADEPSYLETVQKVKRRRKQKGRQRQKLRSHAKRRQEQEQSGEENSIGPNGIDRCKIDDIQLNEDIPGKVTLHERLRNEVDDDESDDDHRLFSSPSCQFAALALV